MEGSGPTPPADPAITQPKLGFVGMLRFFWRQLTSMRTAIVLLLLLAVAAVPGSMWPQRSSDPNGVIQFFANNPTLAPVLDRIQLFDVYTSAWFSAIYILLFISLIGCVLPRTMHHLRALRTKPPRTPARLERLAAFRTVTVDPSELAAGADAAAAIEAARTQLRASGYRVAVFQGAKDLSVSAERGYLRETGNLVFHTALIGVLVAVGLGGGFGYTGQKVVVEGQSFVNVKGSYDSFTPGRFFTDSELQPYRLTLDTFTVTYEEQSIRAYGQPIDYNAKVTTWLPGGKGADATIKVNEPLEFGGTQLYLLGNGYAPTITVRDGKGNIAFTASVPFLPQDANLTSTGVVRAPDAVPEQLAFRGFFYPTAAQLPSGALTSIHPDLRNPVLTLFAYSGDLGLNSGVPQNVYALDPKGLTQIAGGDSGVAPLELRPGETVKLPNGLGSVTFDSASPNAAAGDWSNSVPRFVSLDVHHDPAQGWVLLFAVLAVLGLLSSLFIPRRRVWVKAVEQKNGSLRLEYAGLARGEDPGLDATVEAIATRHSSGLKA
ncbi:MAG TPA: cytochrome c biogenesis protein ResB [Terrimesophilobacter sp.]|nr:cytochrome c biogenesis protein ResB [Terrimesophilobacter sp.]